MKLSIKIMSLMMVLVIACTAFVIPASAADGTVAVTYTVDKYTGEDTMGVVADDIYAVTVYLNNTNPINSLLFPIYYRSDLFTPIDGADMSIMDWEYTIDFDAGLVRAAYAIPAGSDLADTNKYNKANVAAANRVVNNRGAISGLGLKSVESAITNLDTRNPADGLAWWGSLDSSKYGVITLQYSGQNNCCNLQAYGVETPLIQILFKRNAGVSDADVVGAQFGYVEGATVRNDNSVETVTTKFYYDGTSTAGIADMTANYCVVEAAAAPELSISWFKNQIRFNEGNFDYRIVGQFDNFDEIFADINVAAEDITDVGYVFSTSEMDLAAAKAQAEGGAVVYSQVKDCYVSTSFSGTDYAFACLVKNIPDNDTNKAMTLYALGYVEYINADGVTAYAYYNTSANVGTLYNMYK